MNEFVEVTVRVPKPVFVLLRDKEKSVEDYIIRMVVEGVDADLDVDAKVRNLIIDKYGLGSLFKPYNF